MMDEESKVRENVKATKEKSRAAVMEGGSSYASVGRFIADLFANIPS